MKYMSKLTEQITHRTQALHKFLASRLNQEPVFEKIAKDLENITNSLNTGKLTIEIFSQFPCLAQGLNNFLSTRQNLSQLYLFKISSLPIEAQLSQTNFFPALILQVNSIIEQQQIRHPLSPNQNLLIGREHQYLEHDCRSQNAILIALPNYSAVSGVHAEIKPVIDSNSTSPTWQICDLNSRNGTYINGQRVHGCKTLQPGDRITLAYQYPSEKCPEFVFDYEPNTTYNQQASIPLVDCDIVCLVIDLKQILTNEEKQFIDNVSRTQIFRLIIIGDTSGADQHSIQQINTNLSAINNWIKIQFPHVSFELITLPLYTVATYAPCDPSIQQKIDIFCKNLVNIGKNKDDIFISRLTPKLQSAIKRIEQVINDQEESLKIEVQRTDEKLRFRTIRESREQIRKALIRVNEDKEVFFRRAKDEIIWSKNNYLNNHFSKNSLPYKVKYFTDTLKPVPTRQGKQFCIHMQPENNPNLHQAIIQLCQNELTLWANEEWERICNSYGGGGLNELIHRSYATLNIISSLNLTNVLIHSSHNIDFQKILQDSFVEIPSDTSYFNESSNKELIGGVARIGIQVGVAAGLAAFGEPVAVIEQAAGIANSLFNLIGSNLSHPQIQQLKLEEVTEKLRQNCFNYYYDLAKYLLNERIARVIESSLEEEEIHFNRSLVVIEEQMLAYLTELKNCMDSYKVRQNNLAQEKTELAQICLEIFEQ
jgi:FHA domain